jgi:hypothetical protein
LFTTISSLLWDFICQGEGVAFPVRWNDVEFNAIISSQIPNLVLSNRALRGKSGTAKGFNVEVAAEENPICGRDEF